MAIIDPWGGFNQGVSQLNDTFTNIRQQDRQSALDAQNAAAARQSLAMGDIQLQGAQRMEQATQDAIAAGAAVQPGVRTTLYDQQGPAAPVANTQLPAREALAQKIADMKGQTYNPAASYGDNDVTPAAGAAQQAQIAPLQAQMDAIPATAQVEGAPLPPVAMQEQVPVTDADRMGAMIKSYLANGNTAKAAELFKMSHDYAQAQGQMNAAGGGSLEDYYTKLTKASLSQVQSDQIEKALTTVAALAKEGPQYLKMAEPSLQMLPGLEGFSADAVTMDPSKRFTSIDAGNGQTIVYDQQNPKDWKLEKKDPVTDFSSFHQGMLDKGASEGEISAAWHQQKMAEQTAARVNIVNNPMPSRINVNQLSPEEQTAINGAIGAGIVDPYKINSRNQKMLAQAIIANPGANINQLAANMGLARNVNVQNKAGNAAMLPAMINDVQQSGKNLDYSSFAPAGKAGMWWDKLTNNPDYINYSAKRNDIIMRIGGVMRENGMTDQAQKLEEDSAPKSMSPPAFDAWAAAQMKVLGPIMNKYTSQAQGNGTPMGQTGQPVTTKGGGGGAPTAYVYDAATGTMKAK